MLRRLDITRPPNSEHDHFAAIVAQLHGLAMQVCTCYLRSRFSDGETAQLGEFRFCQVLQLPPLLCYPAEFGNDALEGLFRFRGCLLVLAMLGLVFQQRRQGEARDALNIRARIVL